MEFTRPYTLTSLELPVGPYCAHSVFSTAPVPLTVEFTYERGLRARLVDATGDPGEPGQPEYFDFKRILTAAAVDLASSDGGMHHTLATGFEIYELLTEPELRKIEIGLLRQLRADIDEGRVDRLVVARFLELGERA